MQVQPAVACFAHLGGVQEPVAGLQGPRHGLFGLRPQAGRPEAHQLHLHPIVQGHLQTRLISERA